jgi:hypothetical protein
MTHHSTLVQRCRSTNSLLADELEREFSRLENDRTDAAGKIQALGETLKFVYGRVPNDRAQDLGFVEALIAKSIEQ